MPCGVPYSRVAVGRYRMTKQIRLDKSKELMSELYQERDVAGRVEACFRAGEERPFTGDGVMGVSPGRRAARPNPPRPATSLNVLLPMGHASREGASRRPGHPSNRAVLDKLCGSGKVTAVRFKSLPDRSTPHK